MLPFSNVLAVTGELNGPGPIELYARTDILYCTYSSKLFISTLWFEADVLIIPWTKTPSKVFKGMYRISNATIIPFLSISWTSAHITINVVEEVENTVTLFGELEGTTEFIINNELLS